MNKDNQIATYYIGRLSKFFRSLRGVCSFFPTTMEEGGGEFLIHSSQVHKPSPSGLEFTLKPDTLP